MYINYQEKNTGFFAGLLDHKLADVLFKIRMGSTIKKDLSKSEENVTIKEKKQTERELSIPKGKY